jgi:hypothetical protein
MARLFMGVRGVGASPQIFRHPFLERRNQKLR